MSSSKLQQAEPRNVFIINILLVRLSHISSIRVIIVYNKVEGSDYAIMLLAIAHIIFISHIVGDGHPILSLSDHIVVLLAHITIASVEKCG